MIHPDRKTTDEHAARCRLEAALDRRATDRAALDRLDEAIGAAMLPPADKSAIRTAAADVALWAQAQGAHEWVAADTRRLAAIRTALGHDHDDATGPQTLDDAIAALCLRHAEVLGALGEAEALLHRGDYRCVVDALATIRKVRDGDHHYFCLDKGDLQACAYRKANP